MTDNPNYKITFMLDSAAMITVHTPKRGVVEVCVSHTSVCNFCNLLVTGNLTVKAKISLSKIVKVSSKIVGVQ